MSKEGSHTTPRRLSQLADLIDAASKAYNASNWETVSSAGIELDDFCCEHADELVAALRTQSERTAIIEECARACERLAERRFDEYGVRESDTGATYYGGSTAAEYDTRDEEDADCAAAIRALKAAK